MESQEQGFSVMLVGYARISKERSDQTTDLQRNALIKAGVDPRHLFEDHLSGSRDNRPTLKSPLDFLQPGGVILVWKLDRLGRSLSHQDHGFVTASAEPRVHIGQAHDRDQ